ncbi:hypothetical protein OLX02_08710 [Novosphingobium sp. KCTC 2891]|uniref:hypothetical protein n=1 Tax=Novosphingobium sp. KCTC 2891 TaxID=2989730 RepID=UPI002222A910|nr:hypothetical protein [Novosphingobium sp. KCTC 2891]MCW1382903.1 hypothetical protein [Novosphingobium sp. KCTC 2891]
MPNPLVQFPAAFTAANAIAFANPDNSAQPVSVEAPLPVTIGNFAATQAVSAAQLPASLGAKAGAASLSIAPASDLANLEPAGAPITGTAMPGGGIGLTGWLSAIYKACTEGSAVSGSVTAAATVVSASNTYYMGGTFQVTSAGTTCTISYEQSNDGTTWVALPVISAAAANAAPVTTSSAAGLFAFTSAAAFVRARVSTYGSGTVAVTLNQKQQAAPNAGVSLASGAATIGAVTVTGTVNTGTGYTDSTTALAGAATFTGTGRATGSTPYAFFNACAYADQAGTLFVDQSLDTGTTYQPVASQAVPAGSFANLAVRLCGAFGAATLYRVRYVNGATAQATFRLSSSFSAG